MKISPKFEDRKTVSMPNAAQRAESSGIPQPRLKFNFDRVFDMNTNQKEVFQDAGLEIVESVLEGFNGTVLAYGQTSSGKTFTMTGPDIDHEEQMGIIP